VADHHDDHPTEEWATLVGKWTFILTVALAVLYVAAVIVYVR
jgi:uncharacterized membrane protein